MTPNAVRALALHRKYGSSPRVVAHCEACAKITEALCRRAVDEGNSVDVEAAFAGALLHDIGRSRTQLVDHGYVGAEILAGEGVDPAVVEVVRRHVGAGISQEEAKKLGFPAGDYIPRTPEQMIVCFADKMLDGGKARPFEEEVKRFVRKGHDVERLFKLKDEVDKLVGTDSESLALFQS